MTGVANIGPVYWHVQKATEYRPGNVYAPGEGNGLYLYMRNRGLKNLAILPLQTGFYPQDEVRDGHVVFKHISDEFKKIAIASPIEHKWRTIFEATWNVRDTEPRNPQAAPEANRGAWKRRLEAIDALPMHNRQRTDRLPAYDDVDVEERGA